MLNYIQAEVYKAFHRKYTYIALGVLLLLEGLLAAGNAFHNSHGMTTYFGECIVIITEFGVIGFCVCLLTGDIVFAGQYKNSTLKNEVSFGLSRTRIYLGKLLAQTLLSVLYLVVMMGFFIAASAVTLPHSMSIYFNDAFSLVIIGYYLACGIPLWIGAQAALCMCLFLINSDMVASFSYIFLVFMLDSTIQLAGMLMGSTPAARFLLDTYYYFPNPILGAAKGSVGSLAFLGRSWLVGAVWLAVCTAIGLYGFHRKEIK